MRKLLRIGKSSGHAFSPSNSRASPEIILPPATTEDDYGIRVLHGPEVPTVDIVFVHGLTGGQTTTWTAEGETTSWPEKFLSEDVPTARISAFGYDADVVKLLGQTSQNNIGQHARNLLGDLADIRFDTNTTELPIIFVAHSLGGLVCMNALTIANNSEQNRRQILDCTRAIAFLGTPHRGSDLASWATLAANLVNTARRANKAILDTLKPQSEDLFNLVNDFHPMIKSRESKGVGTFNITCYVEELAVSRWGKSFIVVPKNSATLEQYPYKTIHSDHVGMTRFKARDSGYSRVSGELKRWIAEMKAPLVSSPARLEALSTVPFARDIEFVVRVDIIADLEAKLSTPLRHQRVALIGLGGMGKSQIAIEYSYRLRAKLPFTWVFWVHASSYTRFEQGYREIANKLKLPGRDDPKIEILQLVSCWLQDETNGSWLLILDNADDANIFTPAVSQPAQRKDEISHPSLLSYIPQTSNGSVLVTSRNSDAACRIIGNNNWIDIGSMSETESMMLLKAKLKLESSDSLKLVQALDQIPLAITQAAAYIAKSPRMNVAKYLDLFRQSEINQSSLLDRDEGDLRRDPEVPSAVITAWQISFNQIRRDHPSAAEQLSLMSVLNRQGIPEAFLRGDSDRLAFEDALAVLSGFSMIIIESSGECFGMHRLIQLATRKWLEVHNEILKWNQKALTMISKAFPDGRYENWTICMPLLSHAEAVLSSDLQDKEDLLKKASILHNLAWYFYVKGDYQLSKLKIDEAIKIRAKYLTAEDTAMLASTGLCATVLISQGKYAEAEDMHQQTLKLRRKVLGLEHPSTLTSINNLAIVLSKQGRLAEAEDMYQQTLRLSEKVLGLEHPETLTSMNSLAIVLSKQGRLAEAKDMYQQTLKLRRKVLGLEHPETLTSMNNMAVVLGNQGKHAEAEDMYQQTLRLQEKALGLEHPSTLTSINNLAIVLSKQGRLAEAEDMYQQTLRLSEKVLGLEHPETLTSMNNLAIVLSKQGRLAEAEDMHQQTLRLQEKVLGLEHPETLTSINNLAVVLGNQGKHAEAEDMYQQTLKLRRKVLGLEHPETLTSMNNMAVVLGNQGRLAEAEDMYQQTLRLSEKVLGLEHPETLTSMNNLAIVLSKQGRLAEAEDMYQQTLKLLEKVLGLEHPYTRTATNNLTVVLGMQSKQSKHAEAKDIH